MKQSGEGHLAPLHEETGEDEQMLLNYHLQCVVASVHGRTAEGVILIPWFF